MAVLRIPKKWFIVSRRLRTSCFIADQQNDKLLPDYNTTVNVHEHKLKRPEAIKPKPRTLPGKEFTSIIPETLREMEENKDLKISLDQLKRLGQKQLTKEEMKRRQRSLNHLQIPNFRHFLAHYRTENKEKLTNYLRKTSIELLQLNIGLYCNQACSHCHVESSPKRKEMMSRETAEKCMEILKNSPSVHTLDLTGGAPELCSEFRYLVKRGRELGCTVLDRCNLTSLLEPGQENTAEFLASHGVVVIASLPCYSAKNVNLQRGSQVFQRSMEALKILNSLGYGQKDSGLLLHLVYNPLGAFLPPHQAELEAKYKEELWDCFQIQFNNLFTITNMPIKRFADFLYRRNELSKYMELLVRNFNPASLNRLMCRNYVSVSWNGSLYDCDFNQQLDIPMKKFQQGTSKSAPTVWDMESTEDVEDQRIVTDSHCFGCTSGMGSSCQGTTA